jgi:hypothetical protein
MARRIANVVGRRLFNDRIGDSPKSAQPDADQRVLKSERSCLLEEEFTTFGARARLALQLVDESVQ